MLQPVKGSLERLVSMNSCSQMTFRGSFLTSLCSESEFLQTEVGLGRVSQAASQLELPWARPVKAHPG